MRFTLLTFSLLVFTLVSSSVLAEEDDSAIQFISSGGDPLGDDDYVEPVRRSKKHAHKSGRKASDYITSGPSHGAKMINSNTKSTWYASHDLKNPACSSVGYQPNNNAHIGAVMQGWLAGGALDCGKFVQLCNENKKPHKCVKVRIIDKCAGCKENHVDLTKSAFKALSNTGTLDEGETHGLKLYSNDKPNPWDTDLFGPLKLQ